MTHFWQLDSQTLRSQSRTMLMSTQRIQRATKMATGLPSLSPRTWKPLRQLAYQMTPLVDRIVIMVIWSHNHLQAGNESKPNRNITLSLTRKTCKQEGYLTAVIVRTRQLCRHEWHNSKHLWYLPSIQPPPQFMCAHNIKQMNNIVVDSAYPNK